MFEKNKDFFGSNEIKAIEETRILVVGTGALGQMAAHLLVRSGFKHLVLVDPDRMEVSNFNRQLYASVSTVGEYKVDILEKQLKEINPDLFLEVFREYLDEITGSKFIKGCDMILDCVDHIPTKLYLEVLADSLKIPLIHGAVEGWYGQIASIFPGDWILKRIYSKNKEQKVTALMVTVNAVASLQVAEAIKIVTGHKGVLKEKILFLDLLTNDYSYVSMAD